MSTNQGGLLSGALADLTRRPVVSGVWYNNKSMNIDGYKFVQCRFDNCQLWANSSNFEIDHCIIDKSSHVYFGKDALRLVKLFNHSFDWIYAAAPSWAPVRNGDGTISILDNT